MDGGLAQLSDRDLAQLAYARASTAEDHARAVAAGEELARRAAAVHAEHRAAEQRSRDEQTGQAAGLETEHPEPSPEDAHHRRMRSVGLTGVLVAALSLPTIAWALSLPNPDPLSIFERPATEEEIAATERLTQMVSSTITLGPRLVDVGEGEIGLVFRASTVPDGRSTSWDVYCLYTIDAPRDGVTSWGGGGRCVVPSVFDAEGISMPLEVPTGDAGLDVLVWGPRGEPRVERDQPIDLTSSDVGSVLDWLTFSVTGGVPDDDPFRGVDEPERLLMGPGALYLSEEMVAAGLVIAPYLLADESAENEPELCLHARVGVDVVARECAPLSTAEREGIALSASLDGHEWSVRFEADGGISMSGL